MEISLVHINWKLVEFSSPVRNTSTLYYTRSIITVLFIGKPLFVSASIFLTSRNKGSDFHKIFLTLIVENWIKEIKIIRHKTLDLC